MPTETWLTLSGEGDWAVPCGGTTTVRGGGVGTAPGGRQWVAFGDGAAGHSLQAATPESSSKFLNVTQGVEYSTQGVEYSKLRPCTVFFEFFL